MGNGVDKIMKPVAMEFVSMGYHAFVLRSVDFPLVLTMSPLERSRPY